ncbi:homeobox protein caupolican [Caerostris darwini]|uniref:Homeobox protein caupolican n=1 Tax=Caerostris darwini TaxID=1538125 RepID=A0AAV4RS68_9ARAC|nr:hypothetical protein CDAR_372811 [Caerostris darwini]GIY24445.1 homeobox protein caupolican [Caerostris darwini]
MHSEGRGGVGGPANDLRFPKELVISGSSGQNSCYERTGVSPDAQYDARLYPRLSTYAPSYQPEPNLDPTTTPFYAPTLNSTYGMKESPDPWRSISQSASYYYDPTLAAYGYGGLDFNGARRKNVTRDSTSTLKAWLNEHRKNPYPTKGEKIMLAIITKMTLTQVSTWFANARRRLKKENKMTWEPRNKAEAHEDDAKGEDAKEEGASFQDDDKPGRMLEADMDLGPQHRTDTNYRPSVNEPHQATTQPLHQHHYEDSHPSTDLLSAASSSLEATSYTPSVSSSQSSSPDLGTYMSHHRPGKEQAHCFPGDAYKPKIWSLADTATSKGVDPSLMQGYAGDLWLTAGGGGMLPSKGPGPTFQSCAVPFQRLSNYSCSLHGFNPISLQTDTPPQTPPNMKVGAAHQTATVPSSAYIESHGSAYMGQPGLCQQDAMGDGQLQDDKLDSFPSSHGSGLQQSSSSNQNAATDCISEDYDDPSQYSTSSVR